MRHRDAGARTGFGTLAAIGLAFAPLFGQAATEVGRLRWRIGGSSDYAGLENDIRQALDFELLLGASSRLGVRNVGPFHAYWSAPWYAALGEGAGGMVVAAWLLHAVALAAAVLLVRLSEGRRSALIAALALGLAWVQAGPEAFSDFYNPALTVPAVAVAVFAGAAVSTGRWTCLPVLIAAASVGAQLHFAAAPGLIVVVASGLVIGWRIRRPLRKPIVVSAVVLLVLWLPTAVDQAAGTGNVTRLARALVESGPTSGDQPFGRPSKAPPRSERTATAVELTALLRPHSSAQGTHYGTAFGLPRPTPGRTLAAALAIGIAAGLAFRKRATRSFLAAAVGMSITGSLATFALTATFESGFFVYYLAPIPGYGIALWVAAALLAADSAPWRLRRLAIVPGIAALAVTAAAVPSPKVARLLDHGADPTDQYEFAQGIVSRVPEHCLDRGVAIEASTERVADVWTVVVAFDRLGLPATVPRALEPFIGPGHESTGDEAAVVRLPTLDEFRAREDPVRFLRPRTCSARQQ